MKRLLKAMDFVTFDLAKRLKEKGFPQKCFGKYEMQGACYIDDGRFYIGGCIIEVEKAYTAPIISQVLKWLREEKEIDIILYPIFLYNKNNREREYGIEIYAPQLNKPIHLDYFKEWEKGANAGIEYVLDNLIN